MSAKLGPNPHRYSDCGEFVTITLPSGTETTIDAEDYPKVELYRWCSDGGGYARASVWDTTTKKQTGLYMHRLLLSPPATLHIDHIDNDQSNNRRSNLRLATRQQNQGNSKKQTDCSSEFKGVHWNKPSRKWQAKIYQNGRQKYLGLYINEAEAARAYNTAATEHFGEYAKLNFVTIEHGVVA